MKKYSAPAFFFLLYLLVYVETFAQSGKLNDVFAGIEVSLPTVMGQGMDRIDRVICFRTDGTFNHNLRKDDWRTAVTGHYTITGKEVTLQFSGGGKETMTLEADGDLKAQGGLGSYGMLKMGTADRVPPGVYKFNNVTSTGGGASGQVFVGSGTTVALYFDGKGGFSRNAESATMVSGGNVGGGVSNNNKDAGSYSIRDGLLTLTYGNGKTEIHSFFCRPGEKPLMAAINGRIFFMEEKKSGGTTGKPGGNAGKNNGAKAAGSNGATADARNTLPGKSGGAGNAAAPEARTLLFKANEVQGGKALDNLRSIRAKAAIGEWTVTSLVDLVQKRLRIEMRNGETLTAIEQFDSNGALKWEKGKKKALPADRLKEMKSAFESGVLGLRRSVIDRMTNLEIKKAGKDKTVVTAQLDGVKHTFFINDSGELIGDLTTSVITEYSNLKMVNGILLPFTEKQQSGFNKLLIQYTAYEINPAIRESEWVEQ